MTEALVQQAFSTFADFLAVGNERIVLPGGTALRNRALPRIRDANHVTLVHAAGAEDTKALVDAAEATYAGLPNSCFYVHSGEAVEVEAELLMRGYRFATFMSMLLEGELVCSPPDRELRRIETAADWAEYERLVAQNWREGLERTGHQYDPTIVAEVMTQAHLKADGGVRYWLAGIDGTACGFLQTYHDGAGMGIVEDVYTDPAYRHQGLASALMRASVDDLRADGAALVLLAVDPSDSPRHMYAAMGFRPLSVWRPFSRPLA